MNNLKDVCHTCNGSGQVVIRKTKEYTVSKKCAKCNGTGKVLWIDNIFPNEIPRKCTVFQVDNVTKKTIRIGYEIN